MESIFFNLLKSMVDLHCCVNLSCTAKQFSYMYIYIHMYTIQLYIYIYSHNAKQCDPWFITGH